MLVCGYNKLVTGRLTFLVATQVCAMPVTNSLGMYYQVSVRDGPHRSVVLPIISNC